STCSPAGSVRCSMGFTCFRIQFIRPSTGRARRLVTPASRRPDGPRPAAPRGAARTPPVRPARTPALQIHPHALRLRVLLQRVLPLIAAEARLLEAAERQRGIVEVVRVD